MDEISDPITAVTHPDPWSYYERLATTPMHRHESTRMWIASSGADVRAVFADPAARVRPVNLPVPPHLVGTVAGGVFARLVRMTDTDTRASLKFALDAAVASIGTATLDTFCHEALSHGAAITSRPDAEVADWMMSTLPTLVVARAIGVPLDELEGLDAAAGAVAAAFAPGQPTVDPSSADAAAMMLLAVVDGAMDNRTGIAARFVARAVDADPDDVLANLVGLFFQNFDATAGLIGNMLAAPVDPTSSGETADATAEHTLRFDPPVHNTRRFVHEPAIVNGCEIGVDDTILLVLAAANRDPSAPPVFSFGDGVHLCPARSFAPRLATNAVAWMRRHRPALVLTVAGHRPSLNARIPVFAGS